MLTGVLLLTLHTVAATPPRWHDDLLAGYALACDERHGRAGVSDTARGFFLIRTIECDGAHITLTLTRDRTLVEELDYDVPAFGPGTVSSSCLPLTERPLPSLRTGRGVEIGMSGAGVRARLGAPTKTIRTGARGRFTELHYRWRAPARGANDPPVQYEQVYTLKGGRLIQIDFRRDLIGVG